MEEKLMKLADYYDMAYGYLVILLLTDATYKKGEKEKYDVRLEIDLEDLTVNEILVGHDLLDDDPIDEFSSIKQFEEKYYIVGKKIESVLKALEECE